MMKKFITLVLVLVLALGLTVPAMAFTSDTSEDVDHPFDLKIYLVEYDDNDLFGLVALPESDRGYAKNEIVAAVIELDIPDGEDPYADGYRRLAIEGENVRFDVMDNKAPLECTEDTELGVGNFVTTKNTYSLADAKDGGYFPLAHSGDKGLLADDTTHKVLLFAKVTDDEASITVKLVDGEGVNGFETTEGPDTLTVTLDGELYTITKHGVGDDGGYYLITYEDDTTNTAGEETVGIYLYVDDDNVTEGMSIDLDTLNGPAATALGVNTDKELGIWDGTTIKTDGDLFDDIMDIYSDVVVDVFGMDYMLIGNYLRDSFFEDLVSGDTISATVDIEPWTAYVTVPDNIVVDPPKTGDAASIMGFVMVALSGAGVVALRKRG